MFKFWKSLTVITLIGLIFSTGGPVKAYPTVDGSYPVVTILEDGLALSWEIPEIAVLENEDNSVRLEIPGFTNFKKPGVARLPVTYILVALPPQSNPELELTSLVERQMTFSGEIEISPQPAGVIRDVQGIPIRGAYKPAEEIIQFNPAAVELEVLGVMRGVTLARIALYPVRQGSNQLLVASSVEATLDFNSNPSVERLPLTVNDPILSMVKDSVANPEQLQPAERKVIDTELKAETTTATGETAIIEVDQRGITQVTYNHLSDSLFPVGSVNPGNLHLYHAGIEVAFEWDGDDDDSFETGERILFYANPRFSRWTHGDTYHMVEETTAGLRINSRSAAIGGLPSANAMLEAVAEQNQRYLPDCVCTSLPASKDGDLWVWERMQLGDVATFPLSVNLPTVNSSQEATLTAWLVGFTDRNQNPDHRVQVTVNSETLSPVIEWNGLEAVEQDLVIPASTLINGNNDVTISMPGISGISVEGMYFDAISIRYALGSASVGNSLHFTGSSTQSAYSIDLTNVSGLRAYDVTDEFQPLYLSALTFDGNNVTLGDSATGGEHQYILANENGILSPFAVRLRQDLSSLEGDYVIISPGEFTPALTSLISLRQSKGHTVVVENVQAVFDQYGEGRPDPEAIHAFLQDAYLTWSIQPVYVLLVGDGTFDPKNYDVINSSDTYILPYFADVDPWLGETAADNRYAAVDGIDILPDLIIGRLPVNSPDETQTVVDKIYNYETSPPPGDWRSRTTFVADNPAVPDPPYNNFPEEADHLADNYIPGAYDIEKIYLPDTDPTGALTKAHLLSSWNAGTPLITYIGHGSVHRWGTQEILHYNNVINDLTNSAYLPVVLELTCLTGQFQVPSIPTLDESMLRESAGGAVAVWGPTGLGLSNDHLYLGEGFLNSIFNNPQAGIGLATMDGKLHLANNVSEFDDLIDTFVLFGDPAMPMAALGYFNNFIFLPIMLK